MHKQQEIAHATQILILTKMLGTRNIEHYFLLQNVGWVENLRHSNCAHIFSVRKLLCKTQRHVCVCFFSKPRILLPMISLERQRVVESVCHCDFSFLRLKLKRLQLGLNFTLWVFSKKKTLHYGKLYLYGSNGFSRVNSK